MIKQNKRAILLPEILKILIGVLCIVLLLILAFKLYDIFIGKSDLEKARATVSDISGKLEALSENQVGQYLIVAPKEWIVIVYGKSSDSQKIDNKLCMCPKASSDNEYKINIDSECICSVVNKTLYSASYYGFFGQCTAPVIVNREVQSCFYIMSNSIPISTLMEPINSDQVRIIFAGKYDAPVDKLITKNTLNSFPGEIYDSNSNTWQDNYFTLYRYTQDPITWQDKGLQAPLVIELNQFRNNHISKVTIVSRGILSKHTSVDSQDYIYLTKSDSEDRIYLSIGRQQIKDQDEVFLNDDTLNKIGFIDKDGYLWMDSTKVKSDNTFGLGRFTITSDVFRLDLKNKPYQGNFRVMNLQFTYDALLTKLNEQPVKQ